MPKSNETKPDAQFRLSSSLAEVRQHIRTDLSLSETHRRDMASALSTIAKAVGRPAENIPAAPAQLRAALAKLNPAMAGVSVGRWRNAVSLLGAALAHVGIVTIQGRIRDKPSATWELLLPLCGTAPGPRFHLMRFARYCTMKAIEPANVDDDLLAAYFQELELHSLSDDPKRAAREVARAWNAMASKHPAWPQQRLTVPDNRNIFTPGWDAYPTSFKQDVDALLAWLGSKDPFNGRGSRVLRPASLTTRAKQIRLLAGALVLEGVQPEVLTDLRALVTVEHATLAITHFYNKAGQNPSSHVHQLAVVCLLIARQWLKLSEPEIEELVTISENVRPRATGITDRNIDRLQAVSDPRKLKSLLLLPSALMDMARRDKQPTLAAARLAQTAAAVQILLCKPLRMRNLQELQIGVTLVRPNKDLILICQRSSQVKNSLRINAKLEGAAARLVGHYIDIFRPLLAATGGDWLFPGIKVDAPKCSVAIRDQITTAVAEHCGLEWHPHLFRHFGALTLLNDDPRAHGAVQRLLDHKSLQTTMNSYAGLEALGVGERYSELLNRLASEKTSKKPAKKPSKKPTKPPQSES